MVPIDEFGNERVRDRARRIVQIMNDASHENLPSTLLSKLLQSFEAAIATHDPMIKCDRNHWRDISDWIAGTCPCKMCLELTPPGFKIELVMICALASCMYLNARGSQAMLLGDSDL